MRGKIMSSAVVIGSWLVLMSGSGYAAGEMQDRSLPAADLYDNRGAYLPPVNYDSNYDYDSRDAGGSSLAAAKKKAPMEKWCEICSNKICLFTRICG